MATDATVEKEAGEESLWTTSMGKYSILALYVLIDNWYGIETILINLLGTFLLDEKKLCAAFYILSNCHLKFSQRSFEASEKKGLCLRTHTFYCQRNFPVSDRQYKFERMISS